MEVLIEQLIDDFHERDLSVFTPRCVSLPAIPGKVDTVIGMRRVGKTTYLYQKIKELIDQYGRRRADKA